MGETGVRPDTAWQRPSRIFKVNKALVGIQFDKIGIYINPSMEFLENKMRPTHMSSALHEDMGLGKMPRIGVEVAQLKSWGD